MATKTKRKLCDICGEKMAVNIEFENIKSVDCTGRQSDKRGIRLETMEAILLSFFSGLRISPKMLRNKPYPYIVLDRMHKTFLLR